MWKVVIADTAAESRQQSAWSGVNEIEIIGVTDNLSVFGEWLKDQEVDAVDIAQTVTAPEKWIELAVEAKKHVICDTNVQIGIEAISELQAICEKQDIVLLMPNAWRFSPEYVQAREHVLQGAIGKPGVIRMRRSAPRATEGCIFDVLGAEVFDWQRWTFGDVLRVMARSVEHVDETGQAVEYALVVVKHADGTIAHIELSLAEEDEQSSFELTGASGMLQYDSDDCQPIVWEMNRKLVHPGSVAKRFGDRAAADCWSSRRTHFIRAVSSQEPLRMTPEDVRIARKIAQAARQSAESGQPVQLMDGGSST
ncbi:gfo/Idh/MocA family oxidoreductase [Brevibacillus nitrificans]|uniref:Gfo/Idh/MocA family protein n=1 Tax=Brevibacillus nitrificans TaxID=651560 RepID=UPI00285C4832|nr:gfo/Idh/MocA family oxidoreductase [Brevibacillus nitrificans]MDR7316406.1 putative dehydrogenase [Brevibacillus nitrificans]